MRLEQLVSVWENKKKEIYHKPTYRRKVFINQTLLIWDLESTNYNRRNVLNGLHEIFKNSAHQKKKFTNCIKIFTY